MNVKYDVSMDENANIMISNPCKYFTLNQYVLINNSSHSYHIRWNNTGCYAVDGSGDPSPGSWLARG